MDDGRLPVPCREARVAAVLLRSLACGLSVLALLVTAAGCGGTTKSTDADSPVTASSSPATTTSAAHKATAAAKRRVTRDRTRARKLTSWFRKQKMTPSDLYVMGVDAPESFLKVYGISSFRVRNSKVTIKTDMYPNGDNENEFAGACNQVVSGYGASWVRHIEVLGQDDAVHGSWDDADADGTDDSSGFTACQSDL
ncbi:MAG: hypothetical protein JWR35_3818 [Marmoricola sp.]|nr:hypothetical protein [Marmoricola sp.]